MRHRLLDTLPRGIVAAQLRREFCREEDRGPRKAGGEHGGGARGFVAVRGRGVDVAVAVVEGGLDEGGACGGRDLVDLLCVGFSQEERREKGAR